MSLVSVLVLLTALGVGGLAFVTGRDNARDLAQKLTNQAVLRVEERVGDYVEQAPATLELTRRIIGTPAPPGDPRQVQGWWPTAQVLLDVVQSNPQFNKIYLRDRYGHRTSARRVADGFEVEHRWSENGQTWSLTRHTSDGRTWSAPQIVAAKVPYDPRQRPWYQKAQQTPGVVWTEPYFFHSTRKPGITVALATGPDGVLAMDIGLHVLSEFVRVLALGLAPEARVYIVNHQRRLVAHPQGVQVETVQGDEMALSHAAERPDAVLRGLAGLELDHVKRITVDGDGWLCEGRRLTLDGLDWDVIVALPEAYVLGPVEKNSQVAFLLALGVMALALFAGYTFSGWVSRPLNAFALTMERVGRFDIPPEPSPTSLFREVQVMSDALGRMKHSLRSFGKYVPRDLVRTLLQTGQEARLGGSIHPVTVLEFEVRVVDKVRVKGRSTGLKIYELLAESGAIGAEQRARVETYEKAFNAYLERRFTDALALLERLDDGPSVHLRARCEVLEKAPPAEDWDGTFVLTHK